MIGKTESVKTVGNVVVRSVVAAVLESSNITGQTGAAMKAYQELSQDPNMMEQLKTVNLADFITAFNEALKTVTEARRKMMESRGADKNLSWKYESGLVEKSEKAQREMAQLGIELKNLLPENAGKLSPENLAIARAKGLEFARKSKEVTRQLKHIALSLEKRFPDRVQEIRAKLQETINEWRINQGVIPAAVTEVMTPALREESENEVRINVTHRMSQYDSQNDFGLEQSETVLKKLGVEVNKNNKYETPVKGSVYEGLVEALTQYQGFSKAYEIAREQVAEHPETADRLMILADRVVQAKHDFIDKRTKLFGKMSIEVRNVKVGAKVEKMKAENRGAEAVTAEKRKKYYTEVLKRASDRWEREAPIVRKTLLYALGAGLVAAGVIAQQEYAGMVGPVNDQIDTMQSAARAETWQLIQHAFAEIMDKFASIDVAMAPVKELAQRAGLEKAKDVFDKTWPWLAVGGVTAAVSGVVEWLGKKHAAWRLKGREMGAEPTLAAANGVELSAETQEEIDSLQRAINSLGGDVTMEGVIKTLEKQITELGGTPAPRPPKQS